MFILYAKTERFTYIAAAMERLEGYDIQVIYYKRLLRMMYYFKLMIFDPASFHNYVICIMMYIDRYPVTARYFESIITDMISVPMRYDNTVDPGRVQLNIP